MTQEAQHTACTKWGYPQLFLGALFGVALEAAHGFKVVAYLENDLTRLLLTLAHAHAVGLALVVLVWGGSGAALFDREPVALGRALRVGALLIPLGFALSAIQHPEGDPNLAIALVPIGAALVLVNLGATAWRALKA